MTAGALPNFSEALSLATKEIVTQLCVNMPTESGNTLTVPVRTGYNQVRADVPQVTIVTNLGPFYLGTGGSLLEIDLVQNVCVYGSYAPNTSIQINVTARSDAQRRYIVDAIQSGILADYVVDSNGNPIESVITGQFGTAGLIPLGFLPPEWPEPDASAERQEGEPFEGVLTLMCNAWITWTTPPVVISAIQSSNTPIAIVPTRTVPVIH